MQTELDKSDVKHQGRWWQQQWGYRDWAMIFVGLVTLFVIYVGWDLYLLSNAAPPQPNCSFTEFSRTMPPPKRLQVVDYNDEQCLVWIAEMPASTVRSGPTFYVFDSDGALVDWVAESGEGAELDDVLYQAYETGEPITLGEASDRFQKKQDRG